MSQCILFDSMSLVIVLITIVMYVNLRIYAGCVAVSRSGEPVKADAEPVPMEILTPDPSRDYTGAFEGFQDEDISYGKILERTNQGLNMLVKEFGKSNPLHIGSLPRTGKLLSLREFRTCVEERAENDDPGAIYSMLYRPMPSASSREAQISRSGSSIASTDSEYVAELERLYTKSLDDDVRSITGSKKKVFLKVTNFVLLCSLEWIAIEIEVQGGHAGSD